MFYLINLYLGFLLYYLWRLPFLEKDPFQTLYCNSPYYLHLTEISR